jgi:hypothetical protein
MRAATFNMENLFRRPRVMNVEEWAQGRGVFAPRAGNPFPEVTSKADQASDHGALYADPRF